MVYILRGPVYDLRLLSNKGLWVVWLEAPESNNQEECVDDGLSKIHRVDRVEITIFWIISGVMEVRERLRVAGTWTGKSGGAELEAKVVATTQLI